MAWKGGSGSAVGRLRPSWSQFAWDHSSSGAVLQDQTLLILIQRFAKLDLRSSLQTQLETNDMSQSNMLQGKTQGFCSTEV
jgi:hypothetical protein